MGEEAERIDHTHGNASLEKVVEGVVAVLHYVVQESSHLLFVGMAHKANGQRMKDHGITISVELSGMGSCRNLERNIYGMHY